MAKYKEIIMIILLLAIIIMVFMVMKSNKTQNQLLSTLVLGGSMIPVSSKGKKSKPKEPDSEDDHDQEDKDHKKPKLKKIHKQILELFKDKTPKTTGQIKKLLKDQGVSVDDVKLNNSIWNLEGSATLLREKMGKTNYWGPGEWFEDGMFLEEYAEKIPGYKELQEQDEKSE